jgi:hypothetical protein
MGSFSEALLGGIPENYSNRRRNRKSQQNGKGETTVRIPEKCVMSLLRMMPSKTPGYRLKH